MNKITKPQNNNYFTYALACLLTLLLIGFALPAKAQNNALHFDGTNDNVRIAHNTNLNPSTAMTIEAWVRRTSIGYNTVVAKWDDDSNNRGYMLNFGELSNNNNICFIATSTGSWLPSPRVQWDSGIPVAINQWTHIALTFTELGTNNIKLYVNGTLSAQTTWNFPIYANTIDLLLGGYDGPNGVVNGGANSRYFAGDMDNVGIWNKVLTPAEVLTAMNTGWVGNEPGLVAYYQFNQGTANATNTGITTLNDLATTVGGANNGTLTNFTLSAGTVSNWVNGAVPTPEINLQGNATTIADGDITPSTVDHTNFGATLVSTPIVRTFTIQNTGSRILNITSVSNTNTTDFTVGTAPTTVAVGGSATFTVTLNSATTGTKNATITINNDDSNEAAYDFAITGNIINTPSAVRGNMMSFNGSNQSVQVANNTNLNSYATTGEITIEYWAYARDITTVQDILAKRPAANNGGFVIETNAGLTTHFINTNAGWRAVEFAYDLNQWMHIAMVGKASTGELIVYKNGVPAGTSLSGAFTSFNATSAVLRMGRDSEATNARFWNGNLDEVRIWNTARTQAQIRESMHLTLSGTESGLVAYYQFNETTGNAVDAIADNNGTLQNGVSRVPSDVAVAQGTSQRITPSLGLNNFAAANVAVNFTTAPANEFVAYQLRGNPVNGVSQLNVGTNTASCYWVIRQFGTGSVAYNGMNFTLPSSNTISAADVTAPSNLKLYKRPDNSTAAFPAFFASGTSANNTTKVIQFTGFTSQTSFSQFEIGSTSSPLPITLLSFEAKRTNENTVLLNWKTATEIDNKGFEIEQSIDNQAFNKIGFVDGAGNSSSIRNYQFSIRNSETAYYRLKQVDFDGKFNYSPQRYVKGDEVNNFVVYPNPAITNLTLELNGKQTSNELVNLRVYNAQGKQIWTRSSTLTEMQAILNTHFETWKAGLYLIQIQSKDGIKQSKLIKY
ncbi:MAG: choice-of-anchor D domain-containing protein [Microscillaceae bacterium]|nr:choice-of-anchor D domain-containing protein [Microscillaceae bacterium]